MTSSSVNKLFIGLFWIFTFILGFTKAHKIKVLVVPPFADPRNNVTLFCEFDMENDSLYSLKWYKDEHEIFRYMPSQNPRQVTFALNGITHLNGACSSISCSVNILATNSSASGLYRCEVSTEAPTFRIAHRNSSMIFAALPRKDPKLEGAPESARLDDELRINCTTDLSLPPADIIWYMNGKKVSFLFLETATLSRPDRFGLLSRSQGLLLRAQRSHFEGPDETMTLRCTAVLPQWLPINSQQQTRTTIIRIPLHPAHAQLSKYTSRGQQSGGHILLQAMTSAIYLMVFSLVY